METNLTTQLTFSAGVMTFGVAGGYLGVRAASNHFDAVARVAEHSIPSVANTAQSALRCFLVGGVSNAVTAHAIGTGLKQMPAMLGRVLLGIGTGMVIGGAVGAAAGWALNQD